LRESYHQCIVTCNIYLYNFIYVFATFFIFILLLSMDEVSRKYSANAMMGNWGGVKYINKQIEHEVIEKGLK
jgi:hypothetical protein